MRFYRQIMDALRNGSSQLERLRRENEVLRIKADAHDAHCKLMHLLMRDSGGYGCEPDAVHIMRKLADDVEAHHTAEAKAQAGVTDD